MKVSAFKFTKIWAQIFKTLLSRLMEKQKMFSLIDFAKKKATKYNSEMPHSTVQGIFGMWSKRVICPLTTNSKSSYGNLRITLKTEYPENYYIIKFLNAANDAVKEFLFSGNGGRNVSAANILVGNYKFVVIDDANKNGEWDSGEFKNKIQPKEVYPCKVTYQLKGEWDLDIEVKF